MMKESSAACASRCRVAWRAAEPPIAPVRKQARSSRKRGGMTLCATRVTKCSRPATGDPPAAPDTLLSDGQRVPALHMSSAGRCADKVLAMRRVL